MEEVAKEFLKHIDSPEDLRRLPQKDLMHVCSELRDYIIDAVSCNPGHFGASLGVVELTVALHYVFNTPTDKIIWDVGHQAYGHKILTGRRDRFHTNRKYKGLSGFPNIFESEYDAFGVGHSSTSISAALGMAVAANRQGDKTRQTVAVIGDGAMTAGQAFEGLNNLAASKANVLVVLNDNNMAIDPNVGGFSEYLVDIATSHTYNKLRKDVFKALQKFNIGSPRSRDMIIKINNSIKTLLTRQTNIFEGLNIRYFGPVDGHDVERLANVLKDLKEINGPKVLHIITKKGKGFKLAEENQTAWHATGGKFDKTTGRFLETSSNTPKPPKFQDVFGHSIIELAEKNPKIVGITPAMPTGCSLNLMMEKMPDRAFDVGIAEQHAVTFAAGLAISGMVPFCNIYSTFMQRAYDQVIHDVALQKLNVVFCLDRGGLVGADGPTHHGAFDLAYFRCIPNMIVSSPMDEEELRNLMFTAQLPDMGPFSIRYPRGNGTKIDWQTPFHKIEVGTGRELSEGTDLVFLTIGPIGAKVQRIVTQLKEEGISAGHCDMRFVKPLDQELLHKVFGRYKKIITVEDGTIVGGLGSAVIEFMAENGYFAQIKRLGIPDDFIDQGTQTELARDCGYDMEGIRQAARNLAGKL
ncbi:1-deoxy-D-xylulose-5-phosphate synthase [Marinilabilia salmonicolor]|jgi:1-deoxy-D-xylulose-5-phosphate synthase|uniref:1-deoxy-D-xylulose-5-phosphate synthase n=1 Tax=Marinilabilia salmonicolor TaxID=989 RepID=UPI000D076FB6|nr:1-deoxy-D-xylulose-5-phosphate synthase [Marinilabilia salmonicolor]PRZ01855.1 1-deoxy-D-xylulose-5-phosphate synthase [Marinilabilia salmonicolor]